MKKLLFLLVALASSATIFTASADNDRPISVEQLPSNSRQFLTSHFNTTDVSYAKIDNDLFEKSYEVFFVNGTKAEFDGKGNWKDIDCLRSIVPAGIVPEPIQRFVEKNHSGQSIVKISRDRRDYEVELGNGLEITFDLRFNVIGYDD